VPVRGYAASLIERKPRTRRVRIGVAEFEIAPLDPSAKV